MEPFAIRQAAFVTSVGLGGEYPSPLETGVEIALVGKSNVGKSSLINSLCNNYKLARVSSSPGKTRLINYFSLNRQFYLVDLPGYGFAKAPKTEKEKWGRLMEAYLSSGRVTHLFLLLDIRHAPTAEDKQMFQWVLYYGVPFTLVATKADKIAKSKRRQAANAAAKLLGAPPVALPYSGETAEGRSELLDCMGKIVEDHISLQILKTPIDIDSSLLHNME
ncbi:MAG: YihA family ribosome biogenesis GTP-binding protein [Clostridia bacterium]|nr:ribosome biogenesis GTP-binding protein YihA/YsxC [Candidatus Pelethousia sp.]NCB31836.1 YihA family ribosome biogenesis GTP-binding protein [Clostridia bacterium]